MCSGKTEDAIAAFRRGLSNTPHDTRTAIQLARLLATSSHETLRNGFEAVDLAETACEITDYRIPETLDVLAAVYAETRQFHKAIIAAQRTELPYREENL